MASIKFYYDPSVNDYVKLGRTYTYLDLPQGIPSVYRYIQPDSLQNAFTEGVETGVAYGAIKARKIHDALLTEGKQIIAHGKQIIHQKNAQIADAADLTADVTAAADAANKKQLNRTYAVKAWKDPNDTQPTYYKSISSAIDDYGNTNKLAKTFVDKQKKSNSVIKAPVGSWTEYRTPDAPAWIIKRRYKDDAEAAYVERKANKVPNEPRHKSYGAALNKVPKKPVTPKK